jgi:hypothetical protein
MMVAGQPYGPQHSFKAAIPHMNWQLSASLRPPSTASTPASCLSTSSSFDRVVIENAIRCAYLAGTQDEGLIYLDRRLRNRQTYIEWDKQLLGPINDTMGVEQGGCASDRIYHLVNNEQLQTAQQSELGVDLGLVVTTNGDLDRKVISAVPGQVGCSKDQVTGVHH